MGTCTPKGELKKSKENINSKLTSTTGLENEEPQDFYRNSDGFIPSKYRHEDMAKINMIKKPSAPLDP